MSKLLVTIFCLISYFSFTQSKLYPIAFNGKWGLVTDQKEFTCEPIYQYIEFVPLANSYIYYLNDKKGVLNKNGKKLTEPIYSDIILHDSIYRSSNKNKKWNLFNEQSIILSHKYDEIKKINNHLFYAQNNQTALVINVLTNQKIEGSFVNCKNKNQLIIVENKNGKFSFYDSQDFKLIKDEILSYEHITENLLIIKNNNGEQLFNITNNKLLSKKMDIISPINDGFFLGSLANNHYLYEVTTNKLYNLNNIASIKRINFPYVVYQKNGQQGVFNLLKNKIIIKPNFDNIIFTTNGIMVNVLDKYGFYSNRGKLIIPCLFNDFNFYDYFVIVNLNGKYGLYSNSGIEIEKAKFNKIKIYNSSIKCYKSKSLLVIKYDKNTGSVLSKNTYTNYMTVAIGKEKLPKQKFEDLKFGSINSQKSNITLLEKYGWYRPIRTREIQDSIQEYFGPWGLKDENDSVRIRPLFGYVKIFPEYNLTKCYFKRKALDVNYYVKINLIEQSTIGFHFPFILVDQANKTILSRQKFHYLNFNDFNNHSLARGFTTVPVLVDSNANIIFNNLTFYDDYNENILRICKSGKRVFSSKPKKSTDIYSDFYAKTIGAFKINIPPEKNILSITNGNWYFIDSKGKQLNDTSFQYAFNFINGRAIVKRNNKWGVIDTTMKTIIPLEYDYISRIIINDTGYFRVSNSVNQNYIYNHSNGDLKKTNITKLGSFYQGIWTYKISDSDRWGIIDTSLHQICNLTFDRIYSFNNGKAVAIKKGLKTIIDKNGVELIPYFKTKKITVLNSNFYALKMKKGILIINSDADTLLSNQNCKEILDWNDKYIVYKDFRNFIRLFDYQSNIKIPRHTKIIHYSLKDNLLLLKKKSKLMLYNFSKKLYINKKISNIFSLGEGCMIYEKSRLYGYMSFGGDTLTQAVYKKLNPIKNGWAYSKKGSKRMIIDKKGNPLFDFLVFRIKPLGENYLIYTKTGTGLITKDCRLLIQPKYGVINIYNSIFYKAFTKNNKCDIFNLKGEKLNHKPFDDIKAIHIKNMVVRSNRFEYLFNGFIDKRLSFQNIMPFSTSLFILKETYKEGVYNSNGNIIVPVRYHRINIIKNNFQVRFFNSFGFYKLSGDILFDPYTI